MPDVAWLMFSGIGIAFVVILASVAFSVLAMVFAPIHAIAEGIVSKTRRGDADK